MRKRKDTRVLTREKSLGFKYPESLNCWSDRNEYTPYDYFPRETTKVWWKCHNGIHEDYFRSCDGTTSKNFKCPICNTKNQQDTYKERLKETFEDYCKIHNIPHLLELWDYELNDLLPSEIGPHSTKQKIYFKCPEGLHGSHSIYLNNLCKTIDRAKKIDLLCPACRSFGQFVINEYGQGYLDSIWSDKNEYSYFDIAKRSTKTIWLKCLNNDSHPDYDLPASAFILSHNCPYCSGRRSLKNGKRDPKYRNFKPRSSAKNQKIRNSKEYCDWRNRAKEYDNYQCQCCGFSGLRLNVHHIYNFNDYEELRFKDYNSITLCDDHHNLMIKGSFHDEYGSMNNTPEQLEEYINNKRKQLGILIPFNIKDYIENKKCSAMSSWINKINNDPIDEDWEEELNYEPKEV